MEKTIEVTWYSELATEDLMCIGHAIYPGSKGATPWYGAVRIKRIVVAPYTGAKWDAVRVAFEARMLEAAPPGSRAPDTNI